MKPLGKNRWPYHAAKERIPRSAKRVGAIHDQFIKLGPTSINKPLNRSLLNSSTEANSTKKVPQNNVKLGRPSLDTIMCKPASKPTTSSTSTSTTTSPSTSDSDVEVPTKAFTNSLRKGPGRYPSAKIIMESSSSSTDSSPERERIHVPMKSQSWTITEVKMNDIDSWFRELEQLRELAKQRYHSQKHVQDLEEKIIKLETANIKLINENESLVQTVKHLVGEKTLQPSKPVQTVKHLVGEKTLQPSKPAQTVKLVKEEDDCIYID